MQLIAFAIVLLLLLNVCLAVDRHNFKTCDQAEFCKINRAGGHGPYEIVTNSLEVNTESALVSALLSDTKVPEQAPLVLTINVLEQGSVRVRIDEQVSTTLYPRYRLDHLLEASASTPFHGLQYSSDSETTRLQFGSLKSLIIHHRPFSVTFSLQDQPQLILNHEQLLHFQVYQPKTDESNWEEKFKSFTDPKPKGPASFGMDISFPSSQHVYGIPEHASPLSLPLTKDVSDPYRLYNLDVFKYELNEPMALYGSIPFLLSHHTSPQTSSTAAVFWNNAAETFVDISHSDTLKGRQAHFISESGILDLFLFVGESPKQVLSQYTRLTGLPMLPPRFSLGYHQCRWNYRSQQDVLEVNQGFNDHDIPYDVIWLDIEHTDGKKYFTWDKNSFSEPGKMIQALEKTGRKLVTIVDPHTKRDGKYWLHQEAEEKGFYIKDGQGKDFEGHCWPGSSSYLDFLREDVREYWATQFEGHSLSLHTWNDMNEPSVFSGPEITMDKDCTHMQGTVEHRDVHNIYGHHVVQATFQGLLQRKSAADSRPFVLSRSFFAGTQKYSAVWTGDNEASWEHLAASIPMLLSMGISGLPFVGADVGGFFGDPDEELLVRWYQTAALQPFFRAHAHIDTQRREPWLFSQQTTSLLRDAAVLRYSYLPLIYTAFWESSQTGSPVMRPMWYEFSGEEALLDMDDQFMVGDSLLVKPVTGQSVKEMEVYLPQSAGGWYEVESRQFHGENKVNVQTPLEALPLFQRAGSIISKQERIRRSSALMRLDPFTLVIALDKDLNAKGVLYLDDGESFGFQKGEHTVRQFVFDGSLMKLTSTSAGEGVYECSNTIERIVIMGFPSKPGSITQSSSHLSYTFDRDLLTIRKPQSPLCSDFTINLVLE